MKKCSRCKKDKARTEFYKQIRSNDGLAPHCKECDKVRKEIVSKLYRSKPAVKHQRHLNHVKHMYGLTEEQIQDMLKDQKGCCALCDEDFGLLPHRYYIDHCHATGDVRGLLCPRCNTGVGYIENSDKDRVREYLNRWAS